MPVAEKEIEEGLNVNLQDDKLRQIIRLSNGRPGMAIQYIEDKELFENKDKIIAQLENLLINNINERYKYAENMSKDIIEAQKTLNYWLFWFRDLLLMSVNCSELVIYNNIEKYNKCYSLPKLKKLYKELKKQK